MDYAKSDFRKQIYRLKSKQQLLILKLSQKGFPGCKGSYPDCPEIPDNKKNPCKSCPIFEVMKNK